MRKETTKNKYFIYARKSSEAEDRQMASIDSQIDELNKMALENDLQVIDTFTESMSAKAPGRQVFSEMMARIERGEANGIICWKLNRLARNPVDGGRISWLLQNSIIQHIQTFGKSYYPSDNVIVMAVELGMANQFIKDLSTDTKRGLRAKAERGWIPNGSPLGYSHNPYKQKGEKEIIKDPDRFEILQKLIKMVASGEKTPNEAYRLGVDKWALRNKKGRKPSISTWYGILHNPFYYGWFEFPGGSGNWHEGKHEPMITQDEYDKIQDILGAKGSPRPHHNFFMYTGSFRCGECGALITAEKKKKVCKNGNVHRYTYYHCTKRKDPNCTQKVIEEKNLEIEMKEIITSIEIPEVFKNWALAHLEKEDVKDNGVHGKIVDNKQNEYDACLRKFDRLLDMRLNGEISEEDFLRKKDFLNKEQNDLQYSLKQAIKNDTNWLKKAKESLDFAQDANKEFEESLEKRKRVAKILGSNLSLIDKKLDNKGKNPFISLKVISREVKKINSRFEPLKMPLNKEKLELLYSSSPVLLRR